MFFLFTVRRMDEREIVFWFVLERCGAKICRDGGEFELHAEIGGEGKVCWKVLKCNTKAEINRYKERGEEGKGGKGEGRKEIEK